MRACERSRRLNAYHDGELSGEECAVLEKHLRECPSCAQELTRLRRLSGLFAAVEMPGISSDVLDRLRGRVGAVRDVSLLRTAGSLMTVAAALLVACVVWVWQTARVPDSGVEASEDWEIVAVSFQSEAPGEASAEEMLAQWIVSDLARENGSD